MSSERKRDPPLDQIGASRVDCFQHQGDGMRELTADENCWKIIHAKARFSDFVKRAERTPQLIKNTANHAP